MTDSNQARAETAERRRREAEALQGCENEVIATIGTVQNFGALMATDSDLTVIRYASANVAEHLGLDISDVLDGSMEAVLGQQLAHDLRNVAGFRTIATEREYLGVFRVGFTDVDVLAHIAGGSMIIEFQPVDHELAAAATFGLVRQLIAQIDLDSSAEQVCRDAVHPLRGMAGFDRVMAYRFSPSGSGEIIAESRRAGIDSFLGLHFPAFDIPQAARQIFATTPIRTISDVEAEQSPILASAAVGEAPLDLSLAALRGTVAVHMQYLHNMGVRSSLTLPIVVEGELWGLFAFHHTEPRSLPVGLAMACELAGRTLATRIEHRVRQQRWDVADRCADLAAKVLAEEDGAGAAGFDWAALRDDLASFVPCDGVALIAADRIHQHGSCPPETTIRRVSEQPGSEGVLVTFDDPSDALSGLELADTAGAVVLMAKGRRSIRLVFFRDEAAHKVRWAGAPTKDIEDTSEGLRLNPRASFDEFTQSVAGKSLPWTPDDLLACEGLQASLETSQRIRESIDSQQQQQLGLVVQELNHRVRNVLALVQSLAVQTRTSAEDLDGYAHGLEQRIRSLASAHDLLTEQEWRSVDLRMLLERSAAPFDPAGEQSVELTGEPIAIVAPAASLVSLLVYEMFSNAARHGALSTPGGVVSISWERRDDTLLFRWRERGGPLVAPPTRRGFGSVIINEAVPFELEGDVTIDYRPEGLIMEVALPDTLVAARSAPVDNEHVVAEMVSAADRPRSVLVVEDDFLVSLETVRLLEDVGCTDVAAVASMTQAFQALDKALPDFVVLDANLRGEFSGPVAKRLVAEQVPFIFVTGYGSDFSPSEFPDVVTLPKPLDRRRVSDVVRGLFPGLADSNTGTTDR